MGIIQVLFPETFVSIKQINANEKTRAGSLIKLIQNLLIDNIADALVDIRGRLLTGTDKLIQQLKMN